MAVHNNLLDNNLLDLNVLSDFGDNFVTDAEPNNCRILNHSCNYKTENELADFSAPHRAIKSIFYMLIVEACPKILVV